MKRRRTLRRRHDSPLERKAETVRETFAKRDYAEPEHELDVDTTPSCHWAAVLPGHVCEGQLRRCHLVREQFLRDECLVLENGEWRHMTQEEIWDPAIRVWGCDGGHAFFDGPLVEKDRSMLTPEAIAYGERHPRVGARIARDFGRPLRLIERATPLTTDHIHKE